MKSLSAFAPIKHCLVVQAGIGISANIFLLFFRIFTLLLDHRHKLVDLITSHLALVHLIMLLVIVFFVSPDLFESLNFQNDFKCKVLFFVSRVMRSLSICTTCLLSTLQATTISPSTCWLARLKHKFTNYIIYVFIFLWCLSLSGSTNLIFNTVASSNVTQTNLLNINKYCSLSPTSHSIRSVMFTLTTSRDVFFIGIMLLSSAYMVIFLFRHQRRSQHLHSTSLIPRTSPEKRATQTILQLVSFFVVMYWVDFIISSSSTLLWAYDPVVLDVQGFVGNVYATVCPLVLIRSDKTIISILQNMWRRCHQFLTR
ncbi:PREDICTED: putative vomeronasal receptor-like protein 4 [Galeopterus variegatus]|uniref:Vomeronasal type-1 receptor n=1 Tax=Galeopterus variegatus TaxID=482537 RepID=A0ABM0RZK9_GALVR|nr:PREDICTED: putative vomeronasal receptor-like protein 4 [Galeopterus variegatus]